MTGGGRPAPCTRRINGNGNGNVKCALSVGWRGGSGCGGRSTHPWGLGRGLLVCAVLRTRQDRGWASCPTRPRHASGPCGSHPLNRTHPAFDSFPRSAVDPRHAWMNVGMIEVRCCKVEPCSTASAWRSGEGVRACSRWERDPTPIQNNWPCTVGCSARVGASTTSSAPSRQARPPNRLAWRFNAACSTSALPATCSTWRARVRPV